MLIESFRLSNPRLKGELELVDVKAFPLDHPSPKRRGTRVFTLQPDQTFLDSIYEYPASYPFQAAILRNIYIRGGARRNMKDPRAQRPPGRLRLGKKSLKKFLDESVTEVANKHATAEEKLADKMGATKIDPNAPSTSRSNNNNNNNSQVCRVLILPTNLFQNTW